MSDDLIARLRGACRGGETCKCSLNEAADRIERLEREVMRWHGLFDEKHNLLMATKDKSEAAILDLMAERDRAEARLDKAVEALRFYSCDNSCDDCPVSERGHISCGWTARAVLAEIEGGKT